MFAAIGFALVVVGLLGARVTENPFLTSEQESLAFKTFASLFLTGVPFLLISICAWLYRVMP